MRRASHAALAALLGLAACSGDDDAPDPVDLGPDWTFDAAEDALRAASCGPGQSFTRPDAIELAIDPVQMEGDAAAQTAALPGARFVGAYVLSSADDRFGGLSGLAAFGSGNLLAVSDAGAFVWISFDETADFRPLPTAYIAELLDQKGRAPSDKKAADAEDLVLNDGLALVSLEQDHRIEAFDLESCGAAARGAAVASIAERGGGLSKRLPDNSGPEALALLDDGRLLVGIEDVMDAGAPFGLVKAGGVELAGRMQTPDGLSLTGFDTLGDTLYSVHRLYAPAIGNRIAVMRRPLLQSEDGAVSVGPAETLATLTRETLTENLEGIAALPRTDGGVRLVLASDDNFSDRQRTLLIALDVDAPR